VKAAGVPPTTVRISIDFGADASLYQPIAAHGYGPEQFEEMKRFADRNKPARRGQFMEFGSGLSSM
jgi:hypothetical protein